MLLVFLLAPFPRLSLVLDAPSLAFELLLLELLGSRHRFEGLAHNVENDAGYKPKRRVRTFIAHHADKRHDRRGEEGHREHQPKRSAQKPSDENGKVLSGAFEAIARDREQDEPQQGHGKAHAYVRRGIDPIGCDWPAICMCTHRKKEETSPRNERKPEDYYSHLLKQAFLIPHEASFA